MKYYRIANIDLSLECDDDYITTRMQDYAIANPTQNVLSCMCNKVSRIVVDKEYHEVFTRGNRQYLVEDNKYVIIEKNNDIVISRLVLDYKNKTLKVSVVDCATINGIDVAIYLFELLGEGYKIYLGLEGGVAFHSSAIAYQGKAILFSALSGVGKSTQTQLWLDNVDNVVLINDDSPCLRVVDNQIFVYGMPWSGSTCKNANVCYPLDAIVFVTRDNKAQVEEISKKEILEKCLAQSYVYPYTSTLKNYLDILNFLVSYRVVRLGATMTKDSVAVLMERLYNEKII